MGKNKKRDRGVPIAWDAEVRKEQASVMAQLEEARAQEQRDRREAIRQMEQATRETRQAILDAETPEAMIRAMEDFAPEHNGINGARWREILEWCRTYAPFVHPVRKETFRAAGASWNPAIGTIHSEVWRNIWHKTDSVDYPADGRVPEIEYGPTMANLNTKKASFRYFRPDDLTCDETLEQVDALARDVSLRLGGKAMVSAFLGFDVPPELCRWNTKLMEFGIEITPNTYDDLHRRVQPTVAFNIKVIKGGEILATEILRRVVEHNRANFPYRLPRTGKTVYLVNTEWTEADGGVTPWEFDPIDYSDIPDAVLVRPEEDASYIIGEKGENLTKMSHDAGIGKGGVKVTTLPGSPLLPVVLLVPYPRLYADQHEAIRRRIKVIHDELHADPLDYDDYDH